MVLMIVDGMGLEHVKAARIYNGQKALRYERFTCSTKVSTCAADGADINGHCMEKSDHVTDSAAAATAIATGVKVMNGVVSKNVVQQQTDIETILEISKRQGKSTGIIATKLFTDATPAAFVAHADGRDMTSEILEDMFQGALPNLVFGSDTPLHRSAAEASPVKYQFVHNTQDLKSLVAKVDDGTSCKGNCPYVYGGFGQYDLIPEVFPIKSGLPLEITPADKFTELQVPHLSEMTDAALKILKKNETGFFLMVESSMPDMISHHNTHLDGNKNSPSAIAVLVREMLEVENTIKVLESFVAAHPDTLVILTADHETGGLVIEEDKTACLGKENCLPTVRWTSAKYEPTKESLSRHTGADVPLYAIGAGAERFCKARINNIDIKNLALAR
jgi:alkaline phosphatase